MNTRAELITLIERQGGISNSNEIREIADNALEDYFYLNYFPSYQNFFTALEKSGYREQLFFLLENRPGIPQAISAVLNISAGKSPVNIGTITEYIEFPQFPWTRDLLEELILKK